MVPVVPAIPSHRNRRPGASSLAGRLAGAVAAFVAGIVVGAAAVGWAAAPRVVAQHALDLVTEELRWARTNVRVNINTYEPGADTGRHRHPGPTIIHVLEGALEEIRDKDTRVIHAGETVWTAGRAFHTLRNRATTPVRALAVHLDPGR